MKAKRPALNTIRLTDTPSQAGLGQHLTDLLDAYQARPLAPGVYDVAVRHDSWCKLLKQRGPCNCNPDIEIK